MVIEQSELGQIVAGVWTEVLDMPASPCSQERFAPGWPTMTGNIHLSGIDHVTIVFECTTALARESASVMFGLQDGELSKEDVRDAVGELLNILGGNIKAILEGDYAMSLPTVVEGQEACFVHMPGARLLKQEGFHSHGELLMLSLYRTGRTSSRPLGRQ